MVNFFSFHEYSSLQGLRSKLMERQGCPEDDLLYLHQYVDGHTWGL